MYLFSRVLVLGVILAMAHWIYPDWRTWSPIGLAALGSGIVFFFMNLSILLGDTSKFTIFTMLTAALVVAAIFIHVHGMTLAPFGLK